MAPLRRPGHPHLPDPARAAWRWARWGLVLGAVPALLLFAPARWLASILHTATGGRVLLAEARGSVWNGSAQVVLTGGGGSRDAVSLPGRMGWRVRPAWTGVQARVTSDCCMPTPLQVHARLRLGGVTVTVDESADNAAQQPRQPSQLSQTSQWPAALLAGLGTPWNTLQLQGQLAFSTQGLSLEWAGGRITMAGQARLDALQISSRLSTLQPMGSYRITLTGGSTPTLQLQTLDGSLQLSGDGSWVGGRLQFRGEASAAADREAALSNLLNIIGRRSGARSIITVG